MNQSFPGPLSPEEIARVQAYYGGTDVSSPAAAPPPPDPGLIGPPSPPPADAGTYYDYNPAPDAPPPPPAVKPFSWNAPGFEDKKPGPHTMFAGSPAPPLVPHSPRAPAAEPPLIGPPKDPTTGGEATPKEDREFNALVAHLNAKEGSKKTGGGASGGGKAANPDPYGVKAANAAVLGTYDAQKAGIGAQVGAEGDKAAYLAVQRGQLAQQQREDAEIQMREQDEANRTFDSHMNELQAQMDTVRNQKIDPSRLMKSDEFAFGAVLGGIFGGMYMGLNKLDHNPFLDDLNKTFDRDIAVQEKNIDNAQKGVGNQMSFLREQRTTFKDNQLAKLAAKRAMYEAAGNAIEAEAGKYDQPIAQARAAQAIATVDREKGMLDKQIKEHAQLVAQQQAAAGAAQTRALQLEQRKAFGDTFDKLVAAGASPVVAEAEATRMVQNLYGGGAGERPAAGPGAADPVSMVPKDQRTEASKEFREHSDREHAKKALADAYAEFAGSDMLDVSQRNALKARVRGIIKPHMKGANSDADLEQLIEPLVPQGGATSAHAQASRLRSAQKLLDAEGTTPTLDQHAPGWRGAPKVQQTNPDGTPKN